jgi:hypothetical protein
LDDGGQGRLVADLGHPAGQLRVPDGSVTTDKNLVVRSELDGLVGGAEGELATGALGGIPLHTMLRQHSTFCLGRLCCMPTCSLG